MAQKSRMFQITGFGESIPSIECKYKIWCKEVCPDTGRDHWHMFIYLKNARSFNSIRKFFEPNHVEICKGNAQQNIEYVKKDGNWEEEGIIPAQGKRVDIEEIKKTKKIRDVVEMTSDIRMVRMAEKYLSVKEEGRNWVTEVYWYHGSSGSGKTRAAVEEAGDDYWMSLNTGRWFDGYDAHEHVIFDDIRKDFMKFHEWLRILDRYPYKVEVKGGSRQFLAKKIWITSSLHPAQMWEGRKDEDITQLLRRITTIKLFGTEVRGNTIPSLHDVASLL